MCGPYPAHCVLPFCGSIFCTLLFFIALVRPYPEPSFLFVYFVGVYSHGRYLICVCRQISFGMHFKSCLGTPWGLRYDHICKNMYVYRHHSAYQSRTCLIFTLSASSKSYFRLISVEYDLFSGYQRRRLLMFGLSASKMTCFWVISFDDDLFLGYQRCR